MDVVVDVLLVAMLTGAILTGIIWFISACIPKTLQEFLDELEKFLEDHQNKENN